MLLRTGLILGVLLFGSGWQPSFAADPGTHEIPGGGSTQEPAQIVIPESLEYTFPPPAQPPEPRAANISFLVTSSGTDISDTNTTIRELRDPNGVVRATDKIEVSLAEKKITTAGAEVTIHLHPSQFSRPGDYQLFVLVRGQADNRPVSNLAKVIIHRPAAELNIDELKGQSVRLVRYWPLGGADGKMTLTFQETSGRSDVHLNVTTRPIFGNSDAKQQVDGTVIPPASPLQLQAGNEQTTELRFTGVEGNGIYTTAVVANGDTLTSPQRIPLTVIVTDAPICALVAIFVGVLGGFLINYFNERRPRQLLQYKILDLRSQIRQLQQFVSLPTKFDTLTRIGDELRRAEQLLALDNVPDAETIYKGAEQEVAQFHTNEAADKTKARTQEQTVSTQLNAIRQQIPNPSPDQTGALDRAKLDLEEADRALQRDQVDRGNDLLEKANDELATLRLDVLSAEIDALEDAVDDAVASGGKTPDEVKPTRDALRAARGAVAKRDPNSAQTQLEAAQTAFDSLGVRSARGARAPSTAKALMTAMQPRDGPKIEISQQPASRISGTQLDFTLRGGGLQRGDAIQWDYGDDAGDSGTPVNHVYRSAGEYRVRVRVTRAGAPAGQAQRYIQVLPNKIELQMKNVQKAIFRSNLVLSIMALVVACAIGLVYLYDENKTFGGFGSYIGAILWGLGMDTSVRGFAATLGHISPARASV